MSTQFYPPTQLQALHGSPVLPVLTVFGPFPPIQFTLINPPLPLPLVGGGQVTYPVGQ